jgi:hypothetical protein
MPPAATVAGPRRAIPDLNPFPGAGVATTRNWLLVFNCTNIGLANCMKLQAPELEVESIDFGRFQKDFAGYKRRLGGFDLILTAPHFVRNPRVDFASVGRVRTLPVPYFDAYHPDLCYLTGSAGGVLKGVMGDYHSKLVTAAWKKGIPREQVRGLFDPRRYEVFGYFDRWEPAKQRLLAGFDDAGLDAGRYFRGWSLRRPFMHSVNHPAIEVVSDIARSILDAEGVPMVPGALVPHDNLMNGPIYPVYDEIAERLGVPGSYHFKLPTQYRCIDLQAFIDASYALLDGRRRDDVQAHAAQQASLQRVLDAL